MKLSIPAILQNPIPFLLQYNSLNEIQNFKDEHGLTASHYAIATINLEKIKEMIYLGFDFNVLSSNSNIPKIIYLEKQNKKNENFELFKFSNINFSNSSYTPIHLLFFLYSIYSKQGDFFYSSISNKLNEIINLFLDSSELIDNFKDSNNFSVCDYAFLLESFVLIEFCYKKECSFNISRLNSETCIKILEILKIKDPSLNISKIDTFSSNLEKKRMFLDLNTELIKKNTNKNQLKI